MESDDDFKRRQLLYYKKLRRTGQGDAKRLIDAYIETTEDAYPMTKKAFMTLCLLIVVIVIGALSYDGKATTDKCLAKTTPDDATRTVVKTNRIINEFCLGLSIGVGAYALVPKSISSPVYVMATAMIVAILTSTTINSYTKIKIECTVDKIETHEYLMYNVLGCTIGIFGYAFVSKTMQSVNVSRATRARIILAITGCIAIFLSSINLQTVSKCEDVSGVNKTDLETFKKKNISFVSIAAILVLIVVGSGFYKGNEKVKVHPRSETLV